MSLRADLHTHTYHSDGIYSPAQLLEKTKACGISIISITDHDTVAAFEELGQATTITEIEVVPGVELSAMAGDRELHILGYFVNYTNRHLLDYLEFFRYERLKRAERIVKKLNHLNIEITINDVLKKAGAASVGRPHVAYAMMEKGFVRSYQEAFERYIGIGCPAFEKKFQLSPIDAIHLIESAGGLSFLAHPGRSMSDILVRELIESGLDGIETVHPSHPPDIVNHYREVVNQYYLLECGGSDFHGGGRNDEDALGSFTIDEDRIDAMKRRRFSS